MSVPAENVATPTDFVASKAARLKSSVEIHNPSVAVVQGDHGTYRVTRQRIQGRWQYRCQCEFGVLGYGQHVFGTRMPCSHIKAAELVWTERALAFRDSLEVPATQHPPPQQGHWRNHEGRLVLVSGRTVFESGRGSEAPFPWCDVPIYEIEARLRRQGFAPVSDTERVDRFERELAELEKRDISLADKSTRGSEGLCSHRSTVGQALDSIPEPTPGKVGGPAI